MCTRARGPRRINPKNKDADARSRATTHRFELFFARMASAVRKGELMRWSAHQTESLLAITLLQLIVMIFVARTGHLLLRRVGRFVGSSFEYSNHSEN